jgi:hypothetical protein
MNIEKIKQYFDKHRQISHEGRPQDSFYEQMISEIQEEKIVEVERIVEVEKIVEVQVEVQVEKIVEVQVEKIVEVPVEVILDNTIEQAQLLEQKVKNIRLENIQIKAENDLSLAEMTNLNNKYISALQDNEKLSQDNDIFFSQLSDKDRSISELESEISVKDKKIKEFEEKIKNMLPQPKKNLYGVGSGVNTNKMPPLIKPDLTRRSSIKKNP